MYAAFRQALRRTRWQNWRQDGPEALCSAPTAASPPSSARAGRRRGGFFAHATLSMVSSRGVSPLGTWIARGLDAFEAALLRFCQEKIAAEVIELDATAVAASTVR